MDLLLIDLFEVITKHFGAQLASAFALLANVAFSIPSSATTFETVNFVWHAFHSALEKGVLSFGVRLQNITAYSSRLRLSRLLDALALHLHLCSVRLRVHHSWLHLGG